MELKHRLLDHPFYQAWTKGDITLERNNMVSGMYYVNITDANGATKTLKVVVE